MFENVFSCLSGFYFGEPSLQFLTYSETVIWAILPLYRWNMRKFYGKFFTYAWKICHWMRLSSHFFDMNWIDGMVELKKSLLLTNFLPPPFYGNEYILHTQTIVLSSVDKMPLNIVFCPESLFKAAPCLSSTLVHCSTVPISINNNN